MTVAAVTGAQPSPGTSDKAEVFISYSRHPPGDRPDSDPGPAAVHRWRARTLAVNLVDVLEQAAKGRGYQAWRDKSAMTEGDQFADEIDAALLSCAGAVVLLDPEAIEHSPWVRWESAILTWRQRIDQPVRVVPVFIGITAEELDGHGFGPSRINRTLAYAIDPAALDPGSDDYRSVLDQHADKIIKALGVLDGEPTGAIAGWVNSIADCLPANCDSWRGVVECRLSHGERLACRPGLSGWSPASCWRRTATVSCRSWTGSPISPSGTGRSSR